MNSIISKKISFKKLTVNSYKLKAILHIFQNLKSKNCNLKFFSRNLSSTRGFTLVEMLVSISVFMVVMTVATTSLLSIIDGNNKAQSLKSAINNLNFALESMQKNIRVGTNYSGGTNCPEEDTCIIFDSYKDLNDDSDMDNDTVIYRYNNTDKSIERCENPGFSCNLKSKFTRLTAPEVEVKSLKFYISSSQPPRVLITLRGETGSKQKIKTNFNLQTTVSQRAF